MVTVRPHGEDDLYPSVVLSDVMQLPDYKYTCFTCWLVVWIPTQGITAKFRRHGNNLGSVAMATVSLATPTTTALLPGLHLDNREDVDVIRFSHSVHTWSAIATTSLSSQRYFIVRLLQLCTSDLLYGNVICASDRVYVVILFIVEWRAIRVDQRHTSYWCELLLHARFVHWKLSMLACEWGAPWRVQPVWAGEGRLCLIPWLLKYAASTFTSGLYIVNQPPQSE